MQLGKAVLRICGRRVQAEGMAEKNRRQCEHARKGCFRLQRANYSPARRLTAARLPASPSASSLAARLSPRPVGQQQQQQQRLVLLQG
jgi:hypothetical protein